MIVTEGGERRVITMVSEPAQEQVLTEGNRTDA